MSGNFHEQFERSEVPLPSDRSTGFVFTVVALVVAYFWRDTPTVWYAALGMATACLVVAVVKPIWLRPFNIAWMCFALLLSKIVNPIVMAILYSIAIVPAGLLMQLRYDPLRRRRHGEKSYWVERKSAPVSTMKNQF